MNQCSTCAHFFKSPGRDIDDHWACKKIGDKAIAAQVPPSPSPTPVRVEHGGIFVHPSFGCILHEARPVQRLSREQISALLDAAPPPRDAERRAYMAAAFGQMFGWVAGPDSEFLLDWLPEVARRYPHQPMRIVEVGTFGGSTARGLVTLSRGGTIVCIDNFIDMNPASLNGHPDGSSFWNATIKSNGPDLSEYATLKVGDSGVLGEALQGDIDLLLVDAAHDHPSALRDIRLYAAHVVSGGYCLVDDWDMPSVRQACEEYFGSDWVLVRQPDGGSAKMLAMKKR